MKAWDGKTGWSHGHTIQCSVCLVLQHDCIDLAHYCAGVTDHWLARFTSCFQSARCKTSNSDFESWHMGLTLEKSENPTLFSTVRPCLVPRPQYFASVIRFGSRGPGRKVRLSHKPEKWNKLSHLFTQPISSRGSEFSEHFWERDR